MGSPLENGLNQRPDFGSARRVDHGGKDVKLEIRFSTLKKWGTGHMSTHYMYTYSELNYINTKTA